MVAPITDAPFHRATAERFVEWRRRDSHGRVALTDDPEAADAILIVGLHQMIGDPTLRELRRHELAGRYFDKVFVYDERDRPFYTFPGIYPSATRSQALRHAMIGGPYAEVIGSASDKPCEAAQPPDLLFSFRGGLSHPIRKQVLNLKHPRAVLEDSSAVNFFADLGAEVAWARRRYQSLMHRSKFVLCPRGTGPSSFRLFETLAAGRVPVILSDAWVPPPYVDWDACAIRVRERDALRVPQLLEELEPQWEARREHAVRTWNAAFAQEAAWESLSRGLEEADKGRTGGGRPWITSLPYWVAHLPEPARRTVQRLSALNAVSMIG